MRCTLLFRGAVIGTLDLAINDWVGAGNLVPTPGFASIASELVDAARALANLGFLPAGGQTVGGVSAEGAAAGEAALIRAQALCDEMELREVNGSIVPTDWINIFAGTYVDDSFTVMVSLRALSASMANRSPTVRSDSDAINARPNEEL